MEAQRGTWSWSSLSWFIFCILIGTMLVFTCESNYFDQLNNRYQSIRRYVHFWVKLLFNTNAHHSGLGQLEGVFDKAQLLCWGCLYNQKCPRPRPGESFQSLNQQSDFNHFFVWGLSEPELLVTIYSHDYSSTFISRIWK